jgi:hypothetical protein
MKHLAARSMSVNSPNAPFTAPGLGDRIHLLTVAWCYSQAKSEPVRLHLTADKYDSKKAASFAEILKLFPTGHISLEAHEVSGISEAEWINYLNNKGVDAELFSYNDHLGRFESTEKLDISKFLKKIPILQESIPKSHMKFSSKYVTTQWDSTAKTRTLDSKRVNQVTENYRKMGYEIVVVGGESGSPLLRDSLETIASVMSGAELHVGVDSGFMHLALLLLPPSKIHLYNEPSGYWSHHLLRAKDAGCQLNEYYKPISILWKIRIWVTYDNSTLFKAMNRMPLIKNMIYNNALLQRIFKAK